MPKLSPQEHRFATGCVEEFSAHGRNLSLSGFECVYRSHDFADTRYLLRLRTGSGEYALKIDTTSPETGRLQKEYDLLTTLSAYFEDTQTLQVVRPVYISPSQTFFVTEYIDRPTAADLIHKSPDADQVAQIYRRAGEWLHHLHAYRPLQQYGFRPKWMLDNIQAAAAHVPQEIQRESAAMLDVLTNEAWSLRGTLETQVFSHGDFHAQNLIVGRGHMIGLDFTEVRVKLAPYDIVDFLKSDVFRDAPPQEVDRSGILKTNKEMFFRRYAHPIHMGILDTCIRGRLILDWLALWHLNHRCSPYEEDKRHRLGNRLRIAFQDRFD
ncbi:phosphotransferase family protein [Ruegeria lacuscaerulensis]|uniref:phosphotransferase family protein n=1 Tax=Ruegeria lacuscaerulensis TaxID=55218 RepID=UPI0014819AF1|nr:aminoglycoside phosphotransferase family protein [Ruegeria lacuscaerulensis]